MRRNGTLAVCLVMLVCVAAGAAEPIPAEEMQATIQQLKARLAALEEQVAAQKLLMGNAPAFRAVAEDAGARSALPSWLDNFKMFGDLRLRYEGRYNDNWAKDRHRGRFRLRFGFKKTWLDKQMELYVRLASGGDDPTSSNQSFDNSFSKKPVWIDRAYAKYQPNWVKGFTIIGGKFPPPMVHTDLVWDSDVNLEGVWAQYKPQFGPIAPFVNAGYFTVEENWRGYDSILVAYQAGTDWKIAKDVKATFAATYYDYDHYESEFRYVHGNHVNGPGAYGGARGGMLAAEEFETINLTTKLAFKLFGLPMSTYFDWIQNCGETDSTWLWQGQDNGYAAGFKVGENKKKGDWSSSYKYALIEANATPGFNDSDFGFVNIKGHVVRGKYNITDWLVFACSVFYTEGIAGPTENQRILMVQVDLIWKF